MKKIATALLCLFALSTSACYHVNVVTGQPASQTVVSKPWHLGFVYGLVFPNDVDVREECPNGVARVETQMSVPNWLVSALTFGILTPWTVDVTCAAGPASSEVETLKGSDTQALMSQAAELSMTQGEPVYVEITAAE